MNKTKSELDNLKIGIKSLKQCDLSPLDKYYACSMADDPEIMSALMWLADIDIAHGGGFQSQKYIITTEQKEQYDNNSDYWQEQALNEGSIHYDDIDKLQERAWELFVEEEGTLIPKS